MSTCFRRLKALVGNGVLETRGKTRGAQYRILAKGQPASPVERKAAVVYQEPTPTSAMIREAIEAVEKQTARNWTVQRAEALRLLRGGRTGSKGASCTGSSPRWRASRRLEARSEGRPNARKNGRTEGGANALVLIWARAIVFAGNSVCRVRDVRLP